MAAQDERSVSSALTPVPGPLTGIRVIELADEQAEYCGAPRAYTKELFRTKSATLFEHVYAAYLGDGASVYSEAA